MNVWVPIFSFSLSLSFSSSPSFTLFLKTYIISPRYSQSICEMNLHVIYIAKFFIVMKHIAKRRVIIV